MMNKFKKCLSVLLATVLIAIMLIANFAIPSSAADMQGKGTKNNPYIVTTAKQFNDIRKNLKAHYKLGNTIDLSEFSNFEPIGKIGSPFTGSLTCDTDSNGYPLYAIKNLKMKIAPKGCTHVDFYPGYKGDGVASWAVSSGWEAGLIGMTKNGTFKNIILLDVDIVSEVEGGTKYLTYNGEQRYMGMALDDMGTGALIAMGENITVDGCGVTGKIVSASNHAGGLLGNIRGGKVTNSYSYATVKADTGYYSWGSGGFLGSAVSTKISSCFYDGTFSGGATHAGAFAGSVYGETNTGCEFENCYSMGKVLTESSGCFLGTKVHADGLPDRTSINVSSWCYTVAKIEGRTKAQTNKRVTNNNYVSDEVGIYEYKFAVLTKEEMNAKFSENSAWVTKAGSYPTLKNVHPVKDSSKYVVNKNEVSSESSQQSGTTSTPEKDEQKDTSSDKNNKPAITDKNESSKTESGSNKTETSDKNDKNNTTDKNTSSSTNVQNESKPDFTGSESTGTDNTSSNGLDSQEGANGNENDSNEQTNEGEKTNSNGEAVVDIDVNIDNDIIKLSKAETVAVICMLALVVLLFAATMVTVILVGIRLNKKTDISDEDYGE